MWKTKRNDGFSLIEMVVVIAMIGILYSIATPSYRGMVASARRVEATSALNNISILQELYRKDHGKYYKNTGTTTTADMTKYHKYGQTPTASLPTNRKVSCHENGIYFHVENCNSMRYWYWIETANDHGYVAIAHSRHKDGFNTIYPSCTPKAAASEKIKYSTSKTATADWNKTMAGDMFAASNKEPPKNVIDVKKECQK